ncbi:thiolase-like protein [Phascolomyces articulosus]|uniref:propanoyl-CoA C-acyltransferase n=1 Tax=Phascolomyces articulosus TaxID=60185 RepID=A0AAD5KC73_9FUNG|nr:thiolase-like protein [Phascolomyces articulosus]
MVQGRKVYVVGVGMSKFIKPRGLVDYPEFALEAAVKALNDAGLSYDKVDFAACGYVFGDSTSGQRVLYQLGMTQIPIINVNNNCSTGSTALYQARAAIASGNAECALALGFERMKRGFITEAFPDRTYPLDHVQAVITDERSWDKNTGNAPQIFGNAGIGYMEKYGATEKHLAKIAEKNHRHSAKNPYSQFRDIYTLEQVENSPKVFGPLTKLQCCPTSDGAGCAIVASEEFVLKHNLMDQAVEICAQAMATDSPKMLSSDNIEWAGADMTRKAAQEAYFKAGISADDVQVVELHDCFSANELVTYDTLGLVPEGQAHKLIDSGDNTYGGKYVVNPSGGLISKGHPLGATGLAQCTELVWQLRGWTGDRQVPNVEYALQHNVGLGGAVVITIYKKANKKQSAPKTAYNPAVEARAITKDDFAKAASQVTNRAEYMDSVGVAKL